jgi:adenylate cyclase
MTDRRHAIGAGHARRRDSGADPHDSNLLNAYVGSRSGARILRTIRRGYSESIHAAIFLSDMRGFTFGRTGCFGNVVALLNQYFDCQVPAIPDRGGEVLKFMGDGMLAIFSASSSEEDTARVGNTALAAAYDVRSRIAQMGNPVGMKASTTARVGAPCRRALYGTLRWRPA